MPTITEQLRAAGVLKGEPQKSTAQPEDTRSALERFFAPILPSTTLSDYWQGPKYVAQHPIDAASLLSGAVSQDPAGAVPVVGQVKHGIEDISKGNYAGAGGNAIMALLSVLPFMRKAGVSAGGIGESLAGGAGRALSAAGEGADVVASGLNHPLLGAKVPYAAAKVGGGVARKLGSALEGMSNGSSAVDRYMPNRSGRPTRVSSEVPGSSYSEPSAAVPSTGTREPFNFGNRAAAEAENINNASSYGNGRVMQEPKPTEMLDQALEGINPQSTGTYTHEAGYGTVVPNDFSFEAGNPDIPGLTIGADLGGPTSPPAAAPSTNLRQLPRQDEYWGIRDAEMPQAGPRKGEPGYGTDPANLLYDPQTPTSYLRDQLSAETDSGQREFLARAINQRRRIEQAISGTQR